MDWHEGPAPYATDASDVGDELAPAFERPCAQRLIHRPGKLAGVWYEDKGGGKAVSDKSKIDPPGIEFYDAATGKHCKLVTGDSTPFSGWIVYKHPDGQWVTWRKATADDIARIEHARDASDVGDELAPAPKD